MAIVTEGNLACKQRRDVEQASLHAGSKKLQFTAVQVRHRVRGSAHEVGAVQAGRHCQIVISPQQTRLRVAQVVDKSDFHLHRAMICWHVPVKGVGIGLRTGLSFQASMVGPGNMPL